MNPAAPEPAAGGAEGAEAAQALEIEGPSFSLPLKLLASAMMLALLVWGWRVGDELLAAATQDRGGAGFVLATVAVLLGCYIGMLRGRTAISASHIRQRWLWTKQVALAEVTQAKLIHLPAFSWLIAPRLMLKVRGRGLYTFHIGDPAVLAAVKRLGLGSAQPF